MYQVLGYFCDRPDQVLFGVIWIWGVWVRKAVECFKHCLMGHASRSMEDSGAECDLINCGGQEVLEKNVSMLPRD